MSAPALADMQGPPMPSLQPSESHYCALQQRYATEVSDAIRRMPSLALPPLLRDDCSLDDFRHQYATILLGVLLGRDVPVDDAKWLAIDTAALLIWQLKRLHQTVGSA